MTSFVLGDVASARGFDFLRGGNEDGGFALAGYPVAFIGFCVEGKKGGKIGFHGLVFFNGECKNSKKEDERSRYNGEEWENLK